MSIFPFIDHESINKNKVSKNKELPSFKEYAYDYVSNSLLKDETGKNYLVEKNEAIRIWIYKALLTPRYRFCAYSAAFGTEIEDNIIGQSIAEDILTSELQRYIIEALMVNPYIKELGEFSFEHQSNGIGIHFFVLTVYGREDITFFMKGRE